MLIKGTFTAVITPFNSEGKIDEEGLRQNLRFQLKHGIDGIVILGTTGEAPTLNAQEKELVIKIGIEEVKGKALLIVGTGSYATAQTIENTRHAERLGADAALIVAPYYNRPTQEGLYYHFKAVAESVSLPICVYNHQTRTGQNINLDTLKRLAALPNIIGIKEASGGVLQMNDALEFIAHHRPKFSVLTGDDNLILPLMALGGHGVISVISNLTPAPVKALVQACARGDFNTARSLHYQLAPLFKGSTLETNPVPIKAAMEMCGMAAGICRLPLSPLIPENHENLTHIINKLPKTWFS